MSEAFPRSGRGKTRTTAATPCYHCGTPCPGGGITVGDKSFCCDGCRLVYEILDSNGLCNYYELGKHPGLSQIKAARQGKFAYLDNAGRGWIGSRRIDISRRRSESIC